MLLLAAQHEYEIMRQAHGASQQHILRLQNENNEKTTEVEQMRQMLQYHMARVDENSESVRAETHARNADMESSSSVASAASSGIASSQNLIRSHGGRMS